MSVEEYRDCIKRMIDEISNEEYLRRIYLMLHWMFCGGVE